MKRHHRWYIVPLVFGLLAVPAFLALRYYVVHFDWFRAGGIIAHEEHSLMVTAVLLMLLVILPVFALLFVFAWQYRAGNTRSTYLPDWDHAKTDELIWWAIPCEIILVLAAITWSSTHQLDPWKPLDSSVAPVTIKVVSLDWKWLFIYEDEGIATVNELEIPVNTPINFELTSDAPMNSFWIPQLGGQIMTMTGMVTKLHLMATEEGTFVGHSANFSGGGFSGMQFEVHSASETAFKAWVASVKNSGATLDLAAYSRLLQPSENVPPQGYVLASPQLFDTIVKKYMAPMQMGSTDKAAKAPEGSMPMASSTEMMEDSGSADAEADSEATPTDEVITPPEQLQFN